MMPVRRLDEVGLVEVGMVELGDEHGGHAVDRGGLLLCRWPCSDQPGVEVLHDASWWQRCVRMAMMPSTQPKQWKNGTGRHHAVVGTELHALADVEAVVEDVAMREHDALREARGARWCTAS